MSSHDLPSANFLRSLCSVRLSLLGHFKANVLGIRPVCLDVKSRLPWVPAVVSMYDHVTEAHRGARVGLARTHQSSGAFPPEAKQGPAKAKRGTAHASACKQAGSLPAPGSRTVGLALQASTCGAEKATAAHVLRSSSPSPKHCRHHRQSTAITIAGSLPSPRAPIYDLRSGVWLRCRASYMAPRETGPPMEPRV